MSSRTDTCDNCGHIRSQHEHHRGHCLSAGCDCDTFVLMEIEQECVAKRAGYSGA